METVEAGPLLSAIDKPADLRKLEAALLPQICDEVRQFIIDSVSQHGGHFASGLGVVELTVALHYVLNTPEDLLVWDVGHQAYGHKILTGRRELFPLNRQKNGISGFPKRSESPYDTFGVGHSSTSISATLGMAIAAQLNGKTTQQHVAVIGDGALTAGISFEGLNHAGASDTNILIIFNDNNMSIDNSVGGLNHYMTSEHTAPSFATLQKDFNNFLEKLPEKDPLKNTLSAHIQSDIKQVGLKAKVFFESFGLSYYGPEDGHDVLNLVKVLKNLLKQPGPKILHIKTTKGKGYKPAETNQTLWHATGAFDKITGTTNKGKTVSEELQAPKFQEVFGKTILELAHENSKIMGITPAMPSGCSLKYMIEEMPERALDVGIAEQHAVTLSAGLATQGMKVFCNIYSTFMQRAYDMVIHDVALQDLPVIFCLDRAGLVGEDGATHQGAFDLAYMRCIPNMIVSAPMDEEELRNLMFTAQLEQNHHPFVIRYPRGKGVLPHWQTPFMELPIGKGRLIQEGAGIAILSIGFPGNFVKEANRQLAQQNISPAHYDMRFVKPLDEQLLHEIARNFNKIITVEDGCISGGFGSAVLEFMNEHNYKPKIIRLGIPDQFIEHAKQAEQQQDCGFDSAGVIKAVQSLL